MHWLIIASFQTALAQTVNPTIGPTDSRYDFRGFAFGSTLSAIVNIEEEAKSSISSAKFRGRTNRRIEGTLRISQVVGSLAQFQFQASGFAPNSLHALVNSF
jgi:hypothetical protein